MANSQQASRPAPVCSAAPSRRCSGRPSHAYSHAEWRRDADLWGRFGEGDDAPAITATMRDLRCSMVNLDPDSASLAPEVMKAIVRANQNNAGVYGAVTRVGRVAVGQPILLGAAT